MSILAAGQIPCGRKLGVPFPMVSSNGVNGVNGVNCDNGVNGDNVGISEVDCKPMCSS